MSKKLSLRKYFAVAIILLSTIFCMLASTKVEAASLDLSAYSTISQAVYFGPSSSNYASVGRIGAGERVYILDKERNVSWYHIVYFIDGTNGSQRKTGYVPTNTLTSISGNVPEYTFSGGEYKSTATQTVWSTDDSTRVNVGSVSNGEGLTLLWRSGAYAFVEYSTSSGAKRGYLYVPQLRNDFYYGTCVARIVANADVRYGYSNSYVTAGKVYKDEIVTVLARNNDDVYIEYNSTAGRKRGYLSNGYLDYHINRSPIADLYSYNYVPSNRWTSSYMNVRSGPDSTYPVIGSINNEEYRGYEQSYFNGWLYIDYSTSNGKKSGWVYVPYTN